ncbi:putative 54S ribosomal protein L35, mitochondrial [Mollisia scopiformis]|uniref:Large ribosomal subunit protein mL38 n=1 Tax=Mollisia scopiformis TaxID=149040 RepID=A0A194XP32_MOLSC|nr:putative 54S ribosomal protein L35, mitochondrial [Mollisia scopiformis]KUJ22005.1 putative 54S ribosomal protein L35, mitochondrial [Mollisia scopiformis]
MSTSQKAVRPLARCLRSLQSQRQSANNFRTLSSSARCNVEAVVDSTPEKPIFDPETVTSIKGEKALMKSGILPIGSRRRRAAIKSSDNIPFEQLPYLCFQEARKVLQEDREEKLKLIATERLRISNMLARDPSTFKGGVLEKETKLSSMRRYLEWLKIQADINDPLIKKRFEDGEGDMNKPIYRYLADRKWREYQRKIIVQRIEQFGIVPDFLPHFEPTAEVQLAFKNRNVQPGEYIDSRVSEVAPRLKVQVFNKGERLVTVVVIDGDVPDAEKDRFGTRSHFIATDIPLSPTDTSIPLSKVTKEQLVQPWLPPFAQKGSPYHRLAVFVLEQQPGQPKVEAEKWAERDNFFLKSFIGKTRMTPIGFNMFRATWDDGTAGVMERASIEGADIEFKRKKVVALKPKQKARGWEARHASDKYKSLRR